MSSRGRFFAWRRGYGRGRGHKRVSSSPREDTAATSTPKRRPMRQTTMFECPFRAWSLYFPETSYTPGEDEDLLTRALETHFVRRLNDIDKNDIEKKSALPIDYYSLCCDEDLLSAVPDLMTLFKDNCEMVLNSMGLAVHNIVTSENYSKNQRKIHIRLFNYEPLIQLKNLKSHFHGKLVTVRGTAARVSNIKPLVTAMAFSCNKCSTEQVMTLTDGKYSVPSKCPASCRSSSFNPLRNSKDTRTIDWQMIRVQELMSDDVREAGRIPRTVDCKLTADLVDCCVPGDTVSVTAIVKAAPSNEGGGRLGKTKCMYTMYLHAVSVMTDKGQGAGKGPQMEFSTDDMDAIDEIRSYKNVFKTLVRSFCPAIYGHELVKAGLVLGLFGGVSKYSGEKNRIPIRGNPHVLVVGDPGMGKSQMLQAAANLAPRGVYVCGNTTTASGLTVTLSKEGATGGDYALEAGALVLGDQGCCCIDEFDKMGHQHQALLEAMEQQSISIAKAGIVCSLPARTSILAAANPAGGHYNKGRTVAENLKMGSALLSRFDLVFILVDNPNEEMDAMLSKHVMAVHGGRNGSHALSSAASFLPTQDEDESRRIWEEQKPLSERLKLAPGEELPLVSPQLLRKYIGYARQCVYPKLSPEAAQVLQDFYLKLRKDYHCDQSTPITTRQLESLIRLAEARARVDLREVANEHDAEDVVELMKYSMMDTYSDALGIVDFQRSQHGSGMSKRGQAKRFIAELEKIAANTFKSLFSIAQMRQIAKDIGIKVVNFDGFIESLNNQNFLLQKGPRLYQLQTSSVL
ncbi:DNA helicase MCM8-like [Oscarella lobularis]|uniref:DNA helicase MCM8-like n=1 Tax=Oscarella lobularis TaxID=121494 RepID=UPI003314147A